jgi:putative ABC transport system permease protein
MNVWMISVGLSIIAGLLPAWKASRVTPIEALRPK